MPTLYVLLKLCENVFVKISATLITFNEEINIAGVCETLFWVDELIIVDSYSTDKTVEIARKYTDKIFFRKFTSFQEQHEFADARTSSDWLLWIDADERVTPELRQSIENLKVRAPETLPEGFRVARGNWYLGRWIKHSGWHPDYQMRFYQKDKSFWGGIPPHETARVNGKTEILEGEIIHYTKRSLSEHQKTIDNFTSQTAKYYFENGRKVSAFSLFSLPVGAFLRTFILKQGFRDGVPGLMISIMTAYGVFLKYAKTWEHINVKKDEGYS